MPSFLHPPRLPTRRTPTMAVVEDYTEDSDDEHGERVTPVKERAGQGEPVKGSCGDLVERLRVPPEYGDAFKASTIRESSSTLLIRR